LCFCTSQASFNVGTGSIITTEQGTGKIIEICDDPDSPELLLESVDNTEHEDGIKKVFSFCHVGAEMVSCVDEVYGQYFLWDEEAHDVLSDVSEDKDGSGVSEEDEDVLSDVSGDKDVLSDVSEEDEDGVSNEDKDDKSSESE
jgi:hypothetical protein